MVAKPGLAGEAPGAAPTSGADRAEDPTPGAASPGVGIEPGEVPSAAPAWTPLVHCDDVAPTQGAQVIVVESHVGEQFVFDPLQGGAHDVVAESQPDAQVDVDESHTGEQSWVDPEHCGVQFGVDESHVVEGAAAPVQPVWAGFVWPMPLLPSHS